MKINNLPKIITATLVLLVACGKQEVDKKTELENLRKQKTELEGKISAIEAELAKAGESSEDETKKVKMVKIEPVTLKTFNHYVEVQGKIDTDNNVQVGIENGGGILKHIYVKRGDNVKKGQVLADMDATQLNKSMEELKTALGLATTVFEKQEKLWKENVGTEIQYLQAKNNKESIETRIESLKEQIRKTKITAPINGIVDENFRKEGEIIAPGMPAFRVVDLSEFKIIGELAEAYSSKINVGDEVEINFPDINKTIVQRINVVGSTINTQNRTFTIEIRLAPGKLAIKPNMICYLKVKDYSKSKAVVVPINTVQKSSKGSYVYVANGNKTERKNVVLEYTYGTDALLSGGLNEGDKLITFGYLDLTDGQAIKY